MALGVLLGSSLLAYALIASYVYLEPSLPTVDAMRSGSLPVPLRIFSRSGELIAQIGEKRRVPVAYGRDAADVAISTTFGPNTLSGFTVFTDEIVPTEVTPPVAA